MSAAIQVSELRVKYRQKNGQVVDAVQGLSLQVQPGEVVGFLGPNGAGKSSTIKCLMGFVPASDGEALIFGLPAGSIEARKRCGYLPEVALYYPYLTPRETLTLYGELQGLRGSSLKKEVTDLLELIGLGSAMTRQNRTLSKGMLQRVGIAQALLGNPELLILDEVTSGLDPVGRKELRDLLKDRQRNGATLFFSSHELVEVDMLCDRILLINKGQLVEERNLHALKDELRNFSLEFVGHTDLSDLTQHIDQLTPTKVRACFETKEQLLQAIERATRGGAQIIDVVAQEGSLEEYFINRIQEAA